MPRDREAEKTRERIPAQIGRFEADPTPTGQVASFQPRGATKTARNAFFADLGSNGRTCFTCHRPENAWSFSTEAARERFERSAGHDPLFRLVDGANCPTAAVRTLDERRDAYSLLLAKGTIRVGLPLPEGAEFEIAAVDDPYDCNTDPQTGLTSPRTGVVSVYRRPLPTTNLGFLSAIMWDGREPSLESQAIDATLGHAQAATAPSPAQVKQMVDFENGVFTAQIADEDAGALDGDGATGGPVALVAALADFFIGINDPLGGNPTGVPFDPAIFTLYDAWDAARHKGSRRLQQARAAVLRGERIFNTRGMAITDVRGINDVLGAESVPGFCGTCHDTPNVGNHSVVLPIDIGIAGAGLAAPPALDIAGLPVFTIACVAGPLAGESFTLTDPGRALITGKCADLGKFKGPILRGLSARAPFFHNGAAATLTDVVEFYDDRFSIGLSEEEKRDLVAFLQTL